MHKAWRQVPGFRIDDVTTELQEEDLWALDSVFVSDKRKYAIVFILCYYFKMIIFIAAMEVIFHLGAFPVTWKNNGFLKHYAPFTCTW